MNELAKQDYWRGVMYTRIREALASESISGEGVEFGGSNGIIQSWGTAKVNYWHSLYPRTSKLIQNVPEAELEAKLNKNDGKRPFVIWAILKK